MNQANPLILGIESSCDETGVGLVRGTNCWPTRSPPPWTSTSALAGSFPRLPPARTWTRLSPPCSRHSPRPASTLADVDAIAVTSGPGLAGALMVGVSAAKALALATGKPLYAINHLVAHVGVGLLDESIAGACTATGCCRRTSAPCWSPAGTRRFCGCAASPPMLNCWAPRLTTPPARPLTRWPGCWGWPTRADPPSTALAREGNAKAIRFPRGLTMPKYMGTAEEPGPHRYDFSFSGLKTAVARCVEGYEARGEAVPVADVAASFQEAVLDVITAKAVLACREKGITTLLLGGGVAANSRLRELAQQRCLGGRHHPAGAQALAVHRQRRHGGGPGCAAGHERRGPQRPGLRPGFLHAGDKHQPLTPLQRSRSSGQFFPARSRSRWSDFSRRSRRPVRAPRRGPDREWGCRRCYMPMSTSSKISRLKRPLPSVRNGWPWANDLAASRLSASTML